MRVWPDAVKLAAWARSVGVHPWTAYGLEIDRNRNAAINLARYALNATALSTGVVTSGADPKTEPPGTAGGSLAGTVSKRSARPKGQAA
jgi:hypothetical protein